MGTAAVVYYQNNILFLLCLIDDAETYLVVVCTNATAIKYTPENKSLSTEPGGRFSF